MFAVGQAAAGIGFLAVSHTGASWRWLYLVGIGPLLLMTRARRDLPETASPERARFAFRPLEVNSRWLVGASSLGFLFSVFPGALTVFASTIVLEDWGWTASSIHPLFFVWWVLALSGFFVAGRLIDSWGRRPTAATFFLGAFVAGVFAFGAAESDPARAFGLALVVFFLTGATPCNGALTTEPFPNRYRGRVGAIVRLAEIGGNAAAPALAGGLAGIVGGAGPAVGVIGVSYAIGAAAVLTLLPETRGMEAEPGLSDA
jgi:MFS family permease